MYDFTFWIGHTHLDVICLLQSFSSLPKATKNKILYANESSKHHEQIVQMEKKKR